MEHHRRKDHTRFNIKLQFAWITKCRKKLPGGEVGHRLRRCMRDICVGPEVEILKGHVSRDHVPRFLSCPPHVSPSDPLQRVKGKTSRKLLQ